MNDYDKVFPDTLGGRLKKTLKQLDISQRQLTDKIGMASTTFSQIVANKSQPKIDKLYKIAKALGVSMEWLIDGDLNLLSRWQKQKLQKDLGNDAYDRLFNDFYTKSKEASDYIINAFQDVSAVNDNINTSAYETVAIIDEIIRFVNKLSPDGQKRILKIIKALEE